MNYLKKRKGQIFFCLFFCLSYNLYFIFLLPDIKISYLFYLDFLLAVFSLFIVGTDFLSDRKKQEKKRRLLESDALICAEFPEMKDFDLAEHDTAVLQKQLDAQYESICDLQDYIAKWCHEVKIPLSASFLMVERIDDAALKASLKEQLEKISHQLKSALLGSKIQSSLFDIQIRSVSLLECVKTSIKNNQYFLIKNQFQIEIDVADISVYTDKNWLVYVLDQMINNAIKYAAESPVIKIFCKCQGNCVLLFLEDHGEGIDACDLRRIFDKGYTGNSHHNGKYKSTGMGLYMVSKIMQKLGHGISVESEKGHYTRFCISITGK